MSTTNPDHGRPPADPVGGLAPIPPGTPPADDHDIERPAGRRDHRARPRGRQLRHDERLQRAVARGPVLRPRVRDGVGDLLLHLPATPRTRTLTRMAVGRTATTRRCPDRPRQVTSTPRLDRLPAPASGNSRAITQPGAADGELAVDSPRGPARQLGRTRRHCTGPGGSTRPRPGHGCRSTRRWTLPRRRIARCSRPRDDSGRAIASQNVPTAANAGRGEGASKADPPKDPSPRSARKGRAKGREEGEEVMLRAFFGFIVVLLIGAAISVAVASPRTRGRRSTRRSASSVPLDTTLRDENDQPITLRECIAGKPTILVPMYYRCPMNCNLVVQNLRRTLFARWPATRLLRRQAVQRDLRELRPEGTRVRCCGLQEDVTLGEYGGPARRTGWRFLTGTKESVAEVMQTIGFRSEFDKAYKEYNHPNGIIMLSPEGKTTRYFYGFDYCGRDRTAGREGQAGRRHAERADDHAAAVADRGRGREGRVAPRQAHPALLSLRPPEQGLLRQRAARRAVRRHSDAAAWSARVSVWHCCANGGCDSRARRATRSTRRTDRTAVCRREEQHESCSHSSPSMASTLAVRFEYLFWYITIVSGVAGLAGLRLHALLLREVSPRRDHRLDAAHPRLAPARTRLDDHPDDHLLHVLRLGRRGVQLRRPPAGGRDGDLRHRQAVDVEGPVPERPARHHRRQPAEHDRGRAELDRPARAARQPAGEDHADVRGRDPRLRHPRVPQQDRRAARPVHDRSGTTRRRSASTTSSATSTAGRGTR